MSEWTKENVNELKDLRSWQKWLVMLIGGPKLIDQVYAVGFREGCRLGRTPPHTITAKELHEQFELNLDEAPDD